MPAIQVAKSDTFETQRQKINQIGADIFQVTAGGTDLSTGNLKLGDGTRQSPSLAFTTDEKLGIYKADTTTLGFVALEKKLIDISATDVKYYKDIIVQQKKLEDSGLLIQDVGQNYDAGSYTAIPVLGGTGDNAQLDIVVVDWSGSITQQGKNYIPGANYTGIALVGSATGSDATCNFEVPELEGAISQPGSAYAPGVYTAVPLTGGNGSNATAEVTITGTTTLPTTVQTPGSGYVDGTYSSVQFYNTPTQTFVVTVSGGPGTYQYVIDGATTPTLNLLAGNTYRFDMSDASNSTHPLYFHGAGDELNSLDLTKYLQVSQTVEGTPGAFVDLVIFDLGAGSLGYACSQHAGMGGTINHTVGSTGVYGRGASGDVTVSGGAVTDVAVTSAGNGYKQGDTFSALAVDLGGTGSGMVALVGTPVFTGEVTNVVIENNGQDYEAGDILSATDANLGGGGGSGFQYTVSTTPGVISEFEIATYGSGYQIGDVLQLPGATTGVNCYIPGTLNGVAVTLGTGTSFTVPDGSRLEVGMSILTEAGSTGDTGQGVTITNISGNTVTISQAPATAGAATLTFSSLDSLNVTLPSVAGLSIGDTITLTSGNAVLGSNTTIGSIDAPNNIITLSGQATEPGTAVLSFSPVFGLGTQTFQFTIARLGSVDSAVISGDFAGNGYSENDVLTVDPTNLVAAETKIVKYVKTQTLTFSSTVAAGTFTTSQTLNLQDGTIVTFIPTGSTIVGEANADYGSSVSASGGNGSGATFSVTRDAQGVSAVQVTDGGFGYANAETLTIAGTDVGGTSPADDITIQVDSVTDFFDYTILQVNEGGGNTTTVVIEISDANTGFTNPNVIVRSGGAGTYTIATSVDDDIFTIDDVFTPNLTFYVGNTYTFDLNDGSLSADTFALSAFEGGAFAPSLVENVVATLETTNKTIAVASTTGIEVGMAVTGSGVGQLAAVTRVVSKTATSVTIDEFPINAGTITLKFEGAEFTDGVVRDANALTIKVTSSTPTTLYYYSQNNAGYGGSASITIDANNPKVFGSGFSILVQTISSTDVIIADIDAGILTAVTFVGSDLTVATGAVTGNLTAPNIVGDIATFSQINSTSNLTSTAANIVNNGNFFIGSSPQTNVVDIVGSTGALTTSGFVKTLDKFNSNDQIEIEDNDIKSLSGFDILISPAATRVAKINTTSAIIIPAGDTAARPSSAVVENGAIRFNTDSGQYEGYSATTTSWSSLGGVRDLDGNTFISAEETVGANDNKLWFYNDGDNTIRVTPNHLEFIQMKKVRSLNTAAPTYTEWAANTPVTAGTYVKYRNNVFEVTVSGTTATSGSEPTDISGNAFTNGSATLQYNTSAVGLLTFEECLDVQIGPLGDVPLTVSGDLRFQNNEISSLINDIDIRPNAGKKIVCDIDTSLVVPSGTTAQRGSAATGSIRYNTTTLTYEGYDGTNWGSLGGVKDVDQNTYIIPELSAGSNENILYFYNDGSNTVQLTTTALDFYSVDTIRSITSQEFEITAQLMTFNSAQTTLDNTATDTTFLHTSKQYFDLGLSAGLNVDPVLRLDNQGDVFLNVGFGTGVYDGVKIFDGDLKEFELADVKILSEKVSLQKGTVNNGGSNIYQLSVQNGAKVVIVAENTSNNNKEFFEFGVIDNGTDIFHTEYGNVRTGEQLIVPVFEKTASGFARVNFDIGSSVTAGHNVVVTIVSNINKK